jgi:hypothetical protein
MTRTKDILLVGAMLTCGLSEVSWATAWPPAGIPVCVNPAIQDRPKAASDGAGGMFVVWADNRDNPNIYSAYGIRLASDGNIAAGWNANGNFVAQGSIAVKSLVADGRGGAYVILEALGLGYDVYAQHITANGGPAAGWPASGLAIATGSGDQDEAAAALDDSGGVYIVWQDANVNQIRGIRLHPDGTVAPGWGPGGRILSTLGIYAVEPDAVADGAGGLVATWWEQRPPATDYPAYAFRLTPSGDPYPGWPTTGVLVSQYRPAFLQYQAYLASDGAGGVYCAWADLRNAPPNINPIQRQNYWDIYCQHILGTGTIAPGWSADGEPLCTAPNPQQYPKILADGFGGAYVAWQDSRNFDDDIYAIRVLANNPRAPGWAVDGNPVSAGPGYQDFDSGEELAPDTHGGFFAAFHDLPSDRVFLQHMMGDGTVDPTYAPMGNLITPVPVPSQDYPSITPDGYGGVYAAMDDDRGGTDPNNIWAAHIGIDIATGIAVTLMSSNAGSDHVQLTWLAARSLRAIVERREGAGPWQPLGDVATDGRDRLIYDDRSVTPGTSYGYRLSYVDGTTTEHTAETTVLVPRAYTLALAGFRPNPASSADLAISFELPNTASGRLELLDVTGRRVAEHDLSGYAAGRYTERLGEGARVPPGMYWIRLTHGGKGLTARGVVLR